MNCTQCCKTLQKSYGGLSVSTTRSIKRKDTNAASGIPLGLFAYPKEKDGLIYVRQSSLTQQQNNIHSFEMQTEKFLEYFRNMGFTGHIEIIADDEAMSGTLDIHKRPGMSRTVKLIEEEGGKRIGWIGAVHVNRLTRDPWLLTPAHLMKLCFEHDVWIITLRMPFNFKDEYCQQAFMLEAQESARHLKWMKLILGGGKSTASDKGYYDGRPVPWGYIVNRTDPKRKRYIIYRPHAEMVAWLFKRFFELDGNLPALCREVERLPYLFPPFEPGIDTRGARRPNRRRRERREFSEGYTPSVDGLIGILTNPVYIGWWIPLDGGVIERNHEPIVEEWLFTYAHTRLSAYDLHGERRKPLHTVRNGQSQAMLKKVAYAPNGQRMYASCEGRNDTDMYRYMEYAKVAKVSSFGLPVAIIDRAFREKFFEHLRAWKGYDDWEEQVEQLEKSIEQRKQTIRNLIVSAQSQWQESMSTLKNPNIPKTEQMKIDLAKTCAGLEEKLADLEKDLNQPVSEEEEDQRIQYRIYTLLPDLLDYWDSIPFTERLRFIGSLVRRAVLRRPTPGWAVVELEWKRSDWDDDIAHIRLDSNAGLWTEEEETTLQMLYPTVTAKELVQALPNRTWQGIKQKASLLHLQRKKGDEQKSAGYLSYWNVCYRDGLYAEENGLVLHDRNPQWCRLLQHGLRGARSHRP